MVNRVGGAMAAPQTSALYLPHGLHALRARTALRPSAAASGRSRCARWCPTSSRCWRSAPASPRSASRSKAKLEWALAAIVFAALLDGIDGRVARLLKGTSRFGAELDSLADFVNFGVAPALILYFWGLHELKSAGWIAAMVFRDLRGAAARPLQRDDRRSEPARPGPATSSSACRRRPAPSRCCCRSTSFSRHAASRFVAPVTLRLHAGDRLS